MHACVYAHARVCGRHIYCLRNWISLAFEINLLGIQHFHAAKMARRRAAGRLTWRLLPRKV